MYVLRYSQRNFFHFNFSIFFIRPWILTLAINHKLLFITALSEKSIYYGKVAVELSKAVYVKEGLQPPTIAEFTKVYECAVAESKKFAKDPNALLALVAKNAQGFSKDEILRYICYFIQVVGFFSLGEIIGRRNVVGYAEHH